MTVEEVLNYLEQKVAPVKLSNDFCRRYDMYDNSGIIVNCGEEVKAILFSLDLSEKAVAEAKSKGCNLIITHHPAIYGGISRLNLPLSPQSRALSECLNSRISVISMHLNFDAAPQGIDYYLMEGLGGKDAAILAPVENGGYGRVYSVKPQSFESFVNFVKSTFNTQRIICYGGDKTVNKVASFCGQGCDDNAIAFAKANKADIFVSSDLKHHQIADLCESGICVLQLTHYCAEAYGFNKIYLKIKDGLAPSSFTFDERFM